MEGDVLAYTISGVSSQEDPENSNRFSNDYINGSGWISAKACNYPQEIILRLQDVSQVNAIQLLCHHAYIPSKVELLIGKPRNKKDRDPDPKYAKWKPLGACIFKDNKERDHKQRERKTVYVKASGLFVKLIFHQNYPNNKNPSNQVGILSIKIFGIAVQDGTKPVEEDDKYVEQAIQRYNETHSDSEDEMNGKKRKEKGGRSRDHRESEEEDDDDDGPIYVKEPYKDKSHGNRSKRSPKQQDFGFKIDMKSYKELVLLLKEKKEELVNKEKYLDARNLKGMIEELEKNEQEMNLLNYKRTEAIAAEDYETAHECKERYEQLRQTSVKDLPHVEKYLTRDERNKFLR